MAITKTVPKAQPVSKKAVHTLTFQLVVVVERDDDEFYAYCPALRGLHVGGHTIEEAVQNAREAAVGFLEMMIKYNDPIPLGCQADAHGNPDLERWPHPRDVVHTETLLICLE